MELTKKILGIIFLSTLILNIALMEIFKIDYSNFVNHYIIYPLAGIIILIIIYQIIFQKKKFNLKKVSIAFIICTILAVLGYLVLLKFLF